MATRFKDSIQIGTTALTTLAAGVMLYIAGTLQVQDINIVNKPVALTGTGAGANTSTQYDYFKYSGYKPLTATGGAVKQDYQVFNWDYPESYTGSILSFEIDVATAATQVANMWIDCGVVGSSLDTTSGATLFNNLLLSTGSKYADRHSFSGATVIGPNQSVVCYSLYGTGTSLAADGLVKYREAELN